MFPAAPCAEFPNDNPALHRGSVWRCTETCAAATCEPLLLAPETAAPAEDVDIEIVDEGLLDDATVEAVPASAERTPPPPRLEGGDSAEDPFVTFARLLEEVARAAGAREELARGLRGLLGVTRFDATMTFGFDALIAGGHVEQTPAGIRRTDRLTRCVIAWQGILRGESEDFAECGSVALDEWAADLIARLLGNPGQAVALRRELRRRGLAAFGLVEQAA